MATPPERLGFAHADNGSTIPDTDDDGKVVYPEAKLEIENGLHQLETLLEATVDKAFDKFEIYVLRNILTVPADLLVWVRLKHYEVRAPLFDFQGNCRLTFLASILFSAMPWPAHLRQSPSLRCARNSTRRGSSIGVSGRRLPETRP